MIESVTCPKCHTGQIRRHGKCNYCGYQMSEEQLKKEFEE